MSLDVLIEAAEYIERREREAEHGYATVCIPIVHDVKPLNKKHLKPKRGGSSRFTHNELEKNRRANLRICLERLRDQVPASPDSNRHTTLGLLTRAREFIMMLEDRDRLNRRYKEQLRREQRMLARKFQVLRQNATRRKKQDSECGSSTVSTSSGYCTSESFESPDSDETDSLNSATWTERGSSRGSGDVYCDSMDSSGGMFSQRV